MTPKSQNEDEKRFHLHLAPVAAMIFAMVYYWFSNSKSADAFEQGQKVGRIVATIFAGLLVAWIASRLLFTAISSNLAARIAFLCVFVGTLAYAEFTAATKGKKAALRNEARRDFAEFKSEMRAEMNANGGVAFDEAQVARRIEILEKLRQSAHGAEAAFIDALQAVSFSLNKKSLAFTSISDEFEGAGGRDLSMIKSAEELDARIELGNALKKAHHELEIATVNFPAAVRSELKKHGIAQKRIDDYIREMIKNGNLALAKSIRDKEAQRIELILAYLVDMRERWGSWEYIKDADTFVFGKDIPDEFVNQIASYFDAILKLEAQIHVEQERALDG